MTLTPEQRRAVELRDGPLLLAAGAGTGKTSVMVERFAATVLEDGIAVERILAITFTEKAAEELKQRVRARMLAAERPDLARAAEAAAVSTIHGFCARLLRAHALDAGLDPYATVLDEREAGRLRTAAFDAALHDVLGPGGPDGALDVVAAYGPGRVRGMMFAAHAQLRSAGQTEPRLPAVKPVAVAAAATATGAAAAQAAADLAGAASCKSVDAARDALAAAQAAVAAGGQAAPTALDPLRLPRNGAAALTSPACERYRDALAAWRQALVDTRAVAALAVLDALLIAFSDRYAGLKRAAAGLDFDDLELGVRDLLLARDDLRRRWAGRFDAVMVDEFQDVNPLQAEILTLLGRDRLFAVGDRLQSIYGFRHADVGIFDRAAAELGGRGRLATLQRNFRSRRELLDAIDLAFDAAFGEGGFLPLEAGRADADAPSAEPPVELLVCDQTGWEGLDAHGAPPWRQAEARALGARIRAELDAGRPPGDVVVLLRATGDMALYERALADRDIPPTSWAGAGSGRRARCRTSWPGSRSWPTRTTSRACGRCWPRRSSASPATRWSWSRRPPAPPTATPGRHWPTRWRAGAAARTTATGWPPSASAWRPSAPGRRAARSRSCSTARCSAPVTTWRCSAPPAASGAWPTCASCCDWPAPTRPPRAPTCAASWTASPSSRAARPRATGRARRPSRATRCTPSG